MVNNTLLGFIWRKYLQALHAKCKLDPTGPIQVQNPKGGSQTIQPSTLL